MQAWQYAPPAPHEEKAYIKRYRHIFPGDELVRHPADSKVVASFHTKGFRHLDEKQFKAMTLIAGTRYLPERDEIRVSGQKLGKSAEENESWCKKTLQRLLSVSRCNAFYFFFIKKLYEKLDTS